MYVIGGGPGGLAAAYALRARGVRAVVLERADRVGASWRGHYDRLRLHTTRRLSGLPGLPMPRRFGRWPARDDMVRYLEKYAEHHALEIVTGVEVSRVERAPDGSGWLLRATGGRELTGAAVVVATGYNHTPGYRSGPAGTPTPASSCTPPRTATPARTPAATCSSSASATPARRSPSTWWRAAPPGCGWRCARPAPGAAFDGVVGGPAHRRPRPAPAGPPRRPARPPAGPAGRARSDGARAAPPGHRSVQPGRRGRHPGAGRRRRRCRAPRKGRGGGRRGGVRGRRGAPRRRHPYRPGRRDRRHRLRPWPAAAGRPPRRAGRAGGPVVRGARTPKDAPGLYFTGFTNPVSGMLRELRLDAVRIAAAVARRHAGQVSRLPR